MKRVLSDVRARADGTAQRLWPAEDTDTAAAAAAPALDLRRLLVTADLSAVTSAWTAAVVVAHGGLFARPAMAVATVVVLIGVTMGLLGAQRLYQARVCAIKAVESAALARTAGLGGLVAFAAGRLVPEIATTTFALVGTVFVFLLLYVARTGYRSWLTGMRKRDRFVRPVIVLGANDDGENLVRLLGDHPELGYRVVALVGSPQQLAAPGRHWGVPIVEGVDRTMEVVRETRATGVLIAGSALESETLNQIVRELTARGVHVHLSHGVRGIAHTRLRAQTLAREPLLYVEPAALARGQLAVKRALDCVLSCMLLVATAPTLLATALAVKLSDGGPVLFRQERIGRKGEPFMLYKFRTMVTDAETKLADLRQANQRGGPLFKVANDPRITAVGRFLRASSIDELPQLLNVLRGEMSLVGPRPALAGEVALFDEHLLARLDVSPGLTGLWQVEGRDNPSFRVYERLDLFYVENWSVALDLAIILATARAVLGRVLSIGVRTVRPGTAAAILE